MIPNQAANSRLSLSLFPELNKFKLFLEFMFWMAAIMQLYLSISAPFAQLPVPPMLGKKLLKSATENHVATSPVASYAHSPALSAGQWSWDGPAPAAVPEEPLDAQSPWQSQLPSTLFGHFAFPAVTAQFASVTPPCAGVVAFTQVHLSGLDD